MKEKREQICFVLFGDCLRLEEEGFCELLKRKIKGCKIVYFFQDLISKDPRKLDFLNNKRNKVDLIYSFDMTEAKKHVIKFHNIPYSLPKGNMNVDIKYDLSFVGQAKDRLSQLYQCVKEINAQNINSVFYIVGVKKDAQLQDFHNVQYIDWMPYSEYLEIVKQSKCILEVLQGGGTGNTIRVPEAIAYNKLLLSNNKELIRNSLYNADYMLVFDDLKRKDLKGFLGKIPKYCDTAEITPAQFLIDIGDDLDIRNGEYR